MADVLTIFIPEKSSSMMNYGLVGFRCGVLGLPAATPAGAGVIKLFGLTTLSLWLAAPCGLHSYILGATVHCDDWPCTHFFARCAAR